MNWRAPGRHYHTSHPDTVRGAERAGGAGGLDSHRGSMVRADWLPFNSDPMHGIILHAWKGPLKINVIDIEVYRLNDATILYKIKK